MGKLTAQEIITKLKEVGFSISEYAFGDIDNPIPGIGSWEEIEQYGGEGQGDTWYSIKYFKDHDVYIKTEGWYASHHGTEFNYGWGYEVRPQQKTITVYE